MPRRLALHLGWILFGLTLLAGCATPRTKPPSKMHENSLGMRFVALPGTDMLISIWETRVRDFESFATATGYDDHQGVYSLGITGWKRTGASWKKLGFQQDTLHPVCGLSRDDARKFCNWLTEKERAAGLIRPDWEYRLPTDAEWSIAAGLPEDPNETAENKDAHIPVFMPGSTGTSSNRYPWGVAWPPPVGAGNYAGREANDDDWPFDWKFIEEYRDAFPRTSPVGSFSPNALGLFDLSGNAAEWCEDNYSRRSPSGFLRGGSYISNQAPYLLTSDRASAPPNMRYADRGFRCVLGPKRKPE